MLKHGELAALFVEPHVRGTFAVRAEQMPFVNHRGRVVEIVSTEFVEADDEQRFKAAGLAEDVHHLRRIDRERPLPGNLTVIGVTGQKTFWEADDLHAIPIRPFESRHDFLQIPREVAQLGIELTMSDAHAGSPVCW